MPRRIVSETVSDLDHARHRLRELGATLEEITQFVAGWDDFTDPAVWSPEIRRVWLAGSDKTIRKEIHAIRVELHVGTHTEAEDLDEPDELTAMARDIITGSVKSVLAWVDGDPVRAGIVIALETDVDGAHRSSLVNPLRAIS